MSASPSPLGQDNHRYRQMLVNLEAAAEAVEQGQILTEQQLDELRDATRRLRRGIEVYTVSASVPCPQCGELYVPLVPGAPCCSNSRQRSAKTDLGA